MIRRAKQQKINQAVFYFMNIIQIKTLLKQQKIIIFNSLYI